MHVLGIFAVVLLELGDGLCVSRSQDILIGGVNSHLTFFKKGSISVADQPGMPHESQSDRWARLYAIKFIEEPPPRMLPVGTTRTRSATSIALFVT